MPRQRASSAIINPNLGLYYDRDDISIMSKALQDGMNFRISNGKLTNALMGWRRFSNNWSLPEGALAIINFLPREYAEALVFLTASNAYVYNAVADSISYITPRYDTGTVAVAGTAVTGTATVWAANVAAGDKIMFGSAAYTGISPSGNDSNTKVLLHMDGADASTTFTDFNDGGGAHAWTARGNAQVDTADSKFGGASLLCDGTGDSIDTPDSANYTLGSGDFTIDLWFKINGGDGSTLDLAGQSDAGLTAAASAWYLQRISGLLRFGLSTGAAFVTMNSASTYNTTTNTGWHHVAIVRNGNNLFMYVDGVQQATAAFAGAVQDSAAVLSVGARSSAAGTWFGWLDEFRLSNTARWTAAFTPPTEQSNTAWFTVLQVNTDLSLTLVSTAGNIVATSPYTIRRLFHASKTNSWDYDVFVRDSVSTHDQLVVTNGVDFVCSWDGNATAMTIQSAMAFKCKHVLAYKNMMLYANLTNQAGTSKPIDMINSAVGSPFLAGATGVGLSEQFTVHDGQDEIIALRKLGDMAVSYGERHCVPAQFVGDPLVFVFREAAIDVGPISPYAIADFGDYHEFLGTDTSYSFDGVTLRDVNNHVGREMIRTIDPVRKKSTFLHFNEERGEVYWCVPRASDVGSGSVANQAQYTWTEHYLEEIPTNIPNIGTPFSQRQFPFACGGYYRNTTQQVWNTDTLTWAASPTQWNDQSGAAQFPIVLAGDDSGFIYVLNTVQTGNGANLNSFVRSARRATQSDGRGRGLLRRVYVYLAAGMSEFVVTVYGGDTPHGSVTAIVSQSMNTAQPAESLFLSIMRAMRYYEFEFGAPNGGAWEISGWDPDLSPGGMR
jgi:hypothetical protein